MDYTAFQAPLSMGFSQQEYRSGLPFLPSRDLSDPGIKTVSPKSPALQVESFNILHNARFFPPTRVDPKNTP